MKNNKDQAIAVLTGLNDEEVLQNRATWGSNTLYLHPKRHLGKLLFEVAGEPMFFLLVLGWLAMPAHYWPLLMWSLAFWLVWGFLDGGCMMGRTWSMMAAIPQAYQADGYSLAALIFAVVGAAGSFLGGALFEVITRSGWHLGELDGRILYLAVTQLTLLLPWWTRRKLKDFNQQTSARTLLSEAARRFLARQELE